MLIGLNHLKTVSKAPVLDAWFQAEETGASEAELAVASAQELLARVQIKNSIANIPTISKSTVPSLPRFASAPAPVPSAPRPLAAPALRPKLQAPSPVGANPQPPVQTKSPYQALSETLDADSRSSQWLAAAGLLPKFMTIDCFVDMTMTSEGGVSSVLRSPDGFRRTVVCRPDGTISQRITGPSGEEIVRFNTNGDASLPNDKRRNELAG